MERPKNSARGTYDLLPLDTGNPPSAESIPSSDKWFVAETIAKNILINSGFNEIRTPIFEATEIFCRAAGEASDIVNKEMYTFVDRSERSLTLRPEGTAGVVRALLSNGLDRCPKPIKLWYYGPMFRYERSQTGRYRQFTQLGSEIFGSSSPKAEFESIYIAWQIFEELKIPNLTLEINSVGDFASRKTYQEAMAQFLEQHKEQICEDCLRRKDTNPLRALDCKVPADQALYQNSAPRIQDYLSEASRIHQAQLIKLLEAFNVNFVVNPLLVRGLDYYTDTVFEIKTSDSSLGVQNTICAGGRYDGLVKEFGGPSMPAFGWAIGMERLMILAGKLQQANESTNCVVYEEENFVKAFRQALELRKLGQKTLIDLDGKALKKQNELAKKLGVNNIISV